MSDAIKDTEENPAPIVIGVSVATVFGTSILAVAIASVVQQLF